MDLGSGIHPKSVINMLVCVYRLFLSIAEVVGGLNSANRLIECLADSGNAVFPRNFSSTTKCRKVEFSARMMTIYNLYCWLCTSKQLALSSSAPIYLCMFVGKIYSCGCFVATADFPLLVYLAG